MAYDMVPIYLPVTILTLIQYAGPYSMSFSYYKRVKNPPQPTSYGFKQVSPKELGDILKRVTRATYSARLHTDEQRQLNNYDRLLTETGRYRVASACSRRSYSRMSSAATNDTNNEPSKPKRLSEREMNRLIRRLQRPTETFKRATSMPPNDEDKENIKQGKIVRSKSADVQRAKVEKLRRPTTATLAKTLNECHLCYEHENRKNPEEIDAFDYDYSDQKVVPSEEVDYLVERMKTPTVSSGKYKCTKTPEYVDEVKIRENLPLLSGLSRSRTVKEITQRLYPRRIVPQATPITIF